jgi:hypothetical protein
LCRHHHAWLHEGGYTLTRHDGLLVFRDPRGRTITNTTDLLADQLDLLHQQQARPAPPHIPTAAELDQAATAEATAALQHLDGWAATPYRSGAWGWTGPNPAPPPGHAPPAN